MSAPTHRRRVRRLPRTIAPAAVGIATALAAAACGSSASSSATAAATTKSATKTVDLVLWESHAGATNPVAVTEQKIVDKFDAAHPGIHVSILETKASKKALAAAQAGNPPVIAEIGHYDGQYRNSGAVIDQSPMLTGSGGFGQSQLSAFYPGVLANGRIPQKVVNGQAEAGKQYRMPADVKVEELYYNKGLFQRAGITGCPATWTQVGQDLAKLKALSGVTPMGFKDASAHIESVFISNGGSLYKPGSNQKQTMFDSPAGVTTFTQFHSWYSQGLVVFSHGANMRTALANNKMGIVDGTSAGWVKIREAAKANGVQAGACQFPAGTSGHHGNIIQGLGFVIFSHASKAQQQAAFEFEKFWNSSSMQALWSQGSGFAPTVKTAVPLMQSYLQSGAGAGDQVAVQALSSSYSQPRGQSDNYAQVDAALDKAFFDAVTGKASVTSALAGLDKTDAGYLSGSTKI